MRVHPPVARLRAQVVRVAEAGVVGTGMGDDGALDRQLRIDVEVAGRAIEELRPGDDQVAGAGRFGRLLQSWTQACLALRPLGGCDAPA